MRQPKTQLQKTLFLLIKKSSVTSIELRNFTLSSYPPARINNLNELGLQIGSVPEKYKKTHISRYNLLSPVNEAKKIYHSMF